MHIKKRETSRFWFVSRHRDIRDIAHMDNESKRVDCFQCKHFYVTWDPRFPRGCKVFGFKTRQLPSVAVFSSSGEPCEGFERKDSAGDSSGGNGILV